MKIKAVELVLFWNDVIALENAKIEMTPELSAWIKRFKVHAWAEVRIWNDLTASEQEVIGDEEVELKLKKLPVEFVPGWYPPHLYDALTRIFDGDIEKTESQLETILKIKKQ